MTLRALPVPDLARVAGIGVAGNVAGHLEQAGEAADFARVAPTDGDAPRGIFPWYVPPAATADGVADPAPDDLEAADARGVPRFLTTFPVSHDLLVLPAGAGLNLQIEPEVGVLLDVRWDDATGRPAALTPRALGAFDDCSIRRPGARRISHKKNWGRASKGLAQTLLEVADLEPGGAPAALRLASFLRRGGVTHPYGLDTPFAGYSYAGARLLDWLVERLAHQRGEDDTPLEDVGAALARAGRPDQLLVGIGATRYTPLGESTYLVPDDEAIVVVYDTSTGLGAAAVAEAVADGAEDQLPGASVLVQRVVAG